jgi:hypothetical protein
MKTAIRPGRDRRESEAREPDLAEDAGNYGEQCVGLVQGFDELCAEGKGNGRRQQGCRD